MTHETEARPLDSAEIRTLCGDMTDRAVLDIVRTGATAVDVETALAWLMDGEAVRPSRPPLSGAAARVFEILEAEAATAEES